MNFFGPTKIQSTVQRNIQLGVWLAWQWACHTVRSYCQLTAWVWVCLCQAPTQTEDRSKQNTVETQDSVLLQNCIAINIYLPLLWIVLWDVLAKQKIYSFGIWQILISDAGSKSSPFVDGVYYCGSLESRRLKNSFVTLPTRINEVWCFFGCGN